MFPNYKPFSNLRGKPTMKKPFQNVDPRFLIREISIEEVFIGEVIEGWTRICQI